MQPLRLKNLSTSAASFLQGILCKDVQFDIFKFILKLKKRIGSSETDADELKSYEFFSEINWDKLTNKQYGAPFRPKFNGPLDLRHF